VKGRPLRFLAVTLGGWTLGRVAVLATDAPPLPMLAGALAPPVAAAVAGSSPRASAAPVAPAAPARRRPSDRPNAVAAAPRMPLQVASAAPSPRSPGAPAGPSIIASRPAEPIDRPPILAPPLAPTPAARAPARLAGSLWAIARGAGDDRGLPGARLGGSQAGARITYALGGARRIALAARVSTPLEGRGREAALGVEWRPFDAPVRLLGERRWSLDGARGGPTAMLVAGLPPTAVGPLAAEAYLQAGAIARGRVDGFADGAARLAVPLSAGRVGWDLGIGAWGGAQPGAARLDLGPSLGARVPVGDRRLRITLDWRRRVAGRARPASGPALSIGSDF